MKKFNVCLTLALVTGSAFIAQPSHAIGNRICVPGKSPTICYFKPDSYEIVTGLCEGKLICRTGIEQSESPYQFHTEPEYCVFTLISKSPGIPGRCFDPIGPVGPG